jgi:hypothetical protein
MDNNTMQLDIESSGVFQKSSRRRRLDPENTQNLSNGNATSMQESSPFADILGSSPIPPVFV